MANVHQASDLKQMQSLPLEAKIRMTKQRIKIWYESWVRFEIRDSKTKKVRFVVHDIRKGEPDLKDSEYIESQYDGWIYVGFSGGKDSTVLKHIVDSMYDDVPSLFVNTGLEYPEIQKFAKSQKNVVTVRPEMRFDEVIKKYGYPVVSKVVSHNIGIAKRNPEGAVAKNIVFNANSSSLFSQYKWNYLVDAPFSVSDKCCEIMKKRPSNKYQKETGRVPMLGTMAAESKLRYSNWLKYGCNAFDSSRPSSAPLSFWTEQDILLYIKKYNVPYCSVYGDIQVKGTNKFNKKLFNMADYMDYDNPTMLLETTGCSRTGCIFCMFGCHLEKEPNRFQQLKKTHPRQYEYCINGGQIIDGEWKPSKEGLGLGKVLDYVGVDYK